MIPMYLWLRWKLGHKEFKPYGRSNPAVRPNVGFGGKGQAPVPTRWWNELKARWEFRNPLPLTVDPAKFWEGIGYWTAWGFWNGQFVDRAKVEVGAVTAADLRPALLKMKARGATFVGVQDSIYTRMMSGAMKQACKELGLKLAVWEWAKDAQRALDVIAYWGQDVAYAANVEHYGPWGDLAYEVAEKYPATPRAVWTNFTGAGAMQDGTYSVEAAKPFWLNGFVCITEAYLQDNPQGTPEVLDWTARVKMGYSKVFPSIGIYSGWTVERYAHELRNYPHYSVYLAEYLPEFN